MRIHALHLSRRGGGNPSTRQRKQMQDYDLVELADALDAWNKPHVGSAWGKALADWLGLPMTTPRQEELIREYLGGGTDGKENQ